MRPRTRIPQRVVMYKYVHRIHCMYLNIIHNMFRSISIDAFAFQDTDSEKKLALALAGSLYRYKGFFA